MKSLRLGVASVTFRQKTIEEIVEITKNNGVSFIEWGADVVIHLDPWWNYAVENQATDRAHRIGQKNAVSVIKVICEDSIEQKVIELQRIKRDIADKIILSDENSNTKIAIDDLKYLLE